MTQSPYLAPWVQTLVGLARNPALCDVPIQLIGLDPDLPDATQPLDAPAVGQLRERYPESPSEPLQTVTLSDGRCVAVFPLIDRAISGPLLAAVLPGGRNNAEALTALTTLSSHLDEVLPLDEELEGMTDELVRRYEELNFFFDRDSVVSNQLESAQILQNMLVNCNEALRVDASVLVMWEGGNSASFVTADNGLPSGTLDRIIKSDELRLWLQGIRTTIVLNTPDERRNHGLSLAGTERIVASPMLDSNRNPLGALLVINRACQRDYENSDRNLAAALADRAVGVLSVTFDALTGVLQRESFERSVGIALDEARDQRRLATILHINMDQLKLVNDTFGRDKGDEALKNVAAMLSSMLQPGDTLARLGGDEFGMLLRDRNPIAAERCAKAIVRMATEIACGDGRRQLDVGVSIGLVYIDASASGVVDLLARADLACLEAKERGRNRAVVYSENSSALGARRNQMHWVTRLQRSLKEDRFELFAQTLRPTDPAAEEPHFEILLRMRGQDGGYVSPGEFLPVAERYDMMSSIDRWVVTNAIAYLGDQYALNVHGPATFAINLSGDSITDDHFLSFLLKALSESRFPTEHLCFEITETAVIRNLTVAQEFIRRVKQYGCQFALDDFGAGVSSFTNLRALDLDVLKIDGSFIIDMLNDPTSAAMVSAINQVGHTMQLKTVAEFVATAELAAAVADLGVTFQQGYFIDKPVPLAQCLERIATLERSA
ncbi:MAG: EAL domain-containing protein [Pseudomonadota bacterium]